MADALDDLRDDALTCAPVRYLPGTRVVSDPLFCAFVAGVMQANLYAAEQQRLALANRPYVATEDSGRGARHLGIMEGVVKPHRKQTANDKARAEAKKWGLL